MEKSQSNFGAVKIGIIILTLATALIHIGLAIRSPDPFFTPAFLLSGLGYLALLAAYFLPIDLARKYHNLVRWLFMIFAAGVIIAWVAIGDKSWPGGALGYLTKLIEVFLIALLAIDGRQSSM
jgi:hypothetical protein